AVVTQPTALQGDQVVTLTATINYQGSVDTKEFEVTVVSLAPAEYSFENDLLEAKGFYGAGSVTGDRILSSGGSVTYVDGVKGAALNLDGTSGVRLPDNLINTNSYSISLWLKPAAFTSFTTAFFGGASGTSWLSLVPSMNGTDKTRVWAAHGSYYDNGELADRIPQNKWTHLVITVDGDNSDALKIYINGALQLEATGFPRVFTVPGETNEFALGVNYWDTPYRGAIDELKIFNDVITAENFQLVNSASVRCIPVVHAQCELVGLARYGKYAWEPGGFELQCSIDVNLECIAVVAIHSYDKVCPFGLWNAVGQLAIVIIRAVSSPDTGF